MAATAPPSSRFVTGAGKPGSRTPGGSATETDGPSVAKKSRGALLKSKKFRIVLVALLVVGGVGYKMFAPKHVGPPAGGDVVAMDATTLNLAGGHYLKVALSIQLVKGKATTAGFMTSRAAELTIDEFSDRSVQSLSSNTSRKKLMAELSTKIKNAYAGEVYEVFLTQFVTQ